MRPSETAVKARIESLCAAPGRFQRIAEMYVETRFAGQFQNLVPFGRNAGDRTVAGWPDAFSLAAHGKVEALEVTAGEALDHLRDDLSRLSEEISTFVFVAWANEPRAETLTEIRKEHAPKHLEDEQIHLVFRKQLVRELCHPKYAPIWFELGLPVSASPFLYVDVDPSNDVGEADRLFGRPDSGFSPSREEYVRGAVHAPDLLETVKEDLRSKQWALVYGRGAAGKTVLGLQIAFSKRYQVVYYLALDPDSGHDLPALAKAVLATRAAANVLFIVDDVHLLPHVASELWQYWNESSLGSHLLLLGRYTSPDALARGTSAPLARLSEGSRQLKVSHQDMAGVVDRLARRGGGAPLYPPEAALKSWHQRFGGDLLAFSTAVMGARGRFRSGDWTLREEDSSEYILVNYLQRVSKEERADLMVLAALADVELSTPLQALGGVPEGSLRSGLVLKRVVPAGGTRYSLVHPGMGRLLITADGRANAGEIIRDVSRVIPLLGVHVISRMLALGRKSEAGGLLRSAFSDDPLRVCAEVLSGALSGFEQTLKALSGIVSVDLPSLDEAMQYNTAELWDAVRRTPLHFLVEFLEFALGALPRTAGVILGRLDSPEGLAYLQQRGVYAPSPELHAWLQFMGKCRCPLPSPLTVEYAERIAASVMAERHLELIPPLLVATRRLDRPFARRMDDHLRAALNGGALEQMIQRTDLLQLLAFLRKAEKACPWLWHRVRQALTASYLNPLIPETRPDVTGPFIGYVSAKMPEVLREVRPHLMHGEVREGLERRLWQSSPAQLQSFLSAAYERIPELEAELMDTIMDRMRRGSPAGSILRGPLEEVFGFLRFVRDRHPERYLEMIEILQASSRMGELRKSVPDASLSALITLIQLEQPFIRALLPDFDPCAWWNRRKERGEAVEAFPIAVKLADLHDVSDALVPIARSLIENPDLAEWQRSGNGLRQLSVVVDVGYAAAPEASRALIREIATPDWLRKRYANGSAPSIAAALYRIWLRAEPDLHPRFATNELRSKLVRSLNDPDAGLPMGLAYVVQLLGVYSLYGDASDIEPGAVRWPDYTRLNAMAREWFASADSGSAQYQAQLSLGLRELARACPSPQYLDTGIGAEALRRWTSLEVRGGREEAVRGLIFDWFTACSTARWCLLPQAQPSGALLGTP